ncbi:MAG: WecB/TagA/CpsF family glycosyltransferase [Vulcanimicrobiaceae bacterium]
MVILGCRLDLLDAGAAADAIVRYAREGRGEQIVTLGTEMIVHAQKDERFRSIVNGCALSLCDTVGLLAAARARGAALKERVTGIDLIERVCARAATGGLRIFFLGGAPGVAERAASALQGRYPQMTIAGTHDGFFDPAESPAVCEQIRRSGAQLLLAGLGSPRQEYWLAEYLGRTGCGAGIGVGGSFDVLSGGVRRAPAAWRSLGLEWLYRLLKEPKRWRRQLALPYFVLLIVGDGLRARFSKGKT